MTSTNPPTSSEPVIVVGGGLSGVAAALGVALQGGRAIILEASDLLGGAAAYSGGLVWCGANHVAAREGIEDNVEETETYVRAMAHSSPELLDESGMYRYLDKAPVAMKYWEDNSAIRWHVIRGLADYHNECAGAAPEGRYLTNELIDGSELGDWREKMRVSPYFPVGTTYKELLSRGRRAAYVEDNDEVFDHTDGDHTDGDHSGGADEIPDHAGNIAFGVTESRNAPVEKTTDGDPLTFGTGVFASFLNRAAKESNIEFRLEHRVSELLVDAGRVVGVGADSPSGHVEIRGPVILATSTYDWNPELVKEMLGLDPEDFGSVAPQSLRGDGITLARSIGADIAHLPPNVVPILPGWPSSHGTGYNYGPEYALPHSMIVDRTGNRYCDDSYWVDIVKKTLDPDDNHLPFFLIWDEQHHQSYGLGATAPGTDYPEGLVSSGATLEELAGKLGIDADQLVATADRFSENAREGVDPDWGRGSNEYIKKFTGDPNNKPNPVLGAVEKAPFWGLRLKFVGTGIGSSGIHIDRDGHVLRENGETIPGVYAIGSCAAMTTFGTGYNSGMALGRGITLAYLVSHELMGNPIS